LFPRQQKQQFDLLSWIRFEEFFSRIHLVYTYILMVTNHLAEAFSSESFDLIA
jgi:hypothetical protein